MKEEVSFLYSKNISEAIDVHRALAKVLEQSWPWSVSISQQESIILLVNTLENSFDQRKKKSSDTCLRKVGKLNFAMRNGT